MDLSLLGIIAYFLLFYRLGDPPIFIWDEARVATSALEMMRSGNPLVTTYHGEPDNWITKPPLVIWLVTMSMASVGASEWSLRLPSAIAGLCTVLVVYAFVRHVSRSRAAALLSAIVLMGTAGYVGTHVTRTADYDSLLLLFMLGATLCVYLAIEPDPAEGDVRAKWIYGAAGALCAAILTKGVAGTLMIPGLALFVAARGKTMVLIRCPATWVSAAAIILVTFGYYGSREAVSPGYLGYVWAYELGGRYGGVIEGHDHPWHFYLARLTDPWPFWLRSPIAREQYFGGAYPWSLALPVTAGAALLSARPPVRRAALLAVICLSTYLAIISGAATKLVWYLAPTFPFIAMLTAFGGQCIWERMQASGHKLPRLAGRALPAASVAIACLFAAGVAYRNLREVNAASIIPDQQTESFLKALFAERPTLSPVRIVHDGHGEVPALRDGRIDGSEPYNAPEEFYVTLLRARGLDVSIVDSRHDPRPGETLVWCRDWVKTSYAPPGQILRQNEICRAVRWPD